MDKNYIKSHISEQYNQELASLLKLLNKMGQSVLNQFDSLLQAIEEKDCSLAKQTIKAEKRIIAYDQEIHELCYQIMALRSPVASDLRAVLSTLQTTSDLERISDEVAHIAKVIKNSDTIDKNVTKIILIYASKIASHLGKILLALNTLDITIVTNIIQKKKAMSTLYLETIQKLMSLEESLEIDDLTSYLFIVKSLETVYRYSRSIAKYVIFHEEGVDVRHQTNKDIVKQFTHNFNRSDK